MQEADRCQDCYDGKVLHLSRIYQSRSIYFVMATHELNEWRQPAGLVLLYIFLAAHLQGL